MGGCSLQVKIINDCLNVFNVPKGTRLVWCDTLLDIHSDPTASLLSMLKKFNGTRNHVTRPEGKKEARDYIIESFKEYGLHVWTEKPKIGDVSA